MAKKSSTKAQASESKGGDWQKAIDTTEQRGNIAVVDGSGADQRASLHKIPKGRPQGQGEVFEGIGDRAMQGGNFD